MTVNLPTPGEEPWGEELNAAITGIDSEVTALEGEVAGLAGDVYNLEGRMDAVEAGGGGGGGGGPSMYAPLFIFNGESNSGGMAKNAEAAADEKGDRPSVKIWDNAGMASFLTLNIPNNNIIGHDAIPSNGSFHGWELGLANSVQAGEWLDSVVYLVKTGQGASVISEWNVGGSYWTRFLARTRGAISLLRSQGKIPQIYFWWTLGLNDWIGTLHTPVATWKPAVVAHFAKVRAELGYVPIFINTYMPEANMDGSGYTEALYEIAAADNMTHIIDATGAPVTVGDVYHWTYAGMKILAGRHGAASRSFGQHEGYDARRIDRMSGSVGLAPPITPVSPPAVTAAPTITGSTTLGSVLSCSTGTWNGSPTGYAYQWKRDGTNIAGQTTSSHTVVTADQGHGLSCTVTATNTSGSASSTTSSTSVPAAAGAPSNSVLPAVTGSTTLGAVLTCSQGTWSNTPTSYAYQWKRDGTDISGQTATTHTIVAADQGHTLTTSVTATNASGSSTATSAGTSVPAAAVAPPGAVTWGQMAGAHASGNKLICDMSSGNYLYGGVTSDPVTIDLTQPWEVVTLLESDAVTDTTMTFIDDDIGANPFDWYNANGIVAWYKDSGVWHFPSVGLTDVSLTPPPGLSYPCRIKLAKAGNDVTIAFGAGATGSFDAPWAQRTGVLAGRTVGYLKVDFALPAIGKTVSVWATGATGAPVPLNTALPTVTGATTLGATLTCAPGTWTNSPTSYAYQWRRDGVAISGATATQYVIVAADQGTNLTCAETATNAVGSNSAISAATAVPAGPSPWTPVTYQDAVACTASDGTLTFNGTSLPAGANIVGTVDATQPFQLMVEWPADVTKSDGIIFLLDTANSTNMNYETTGPYPTGIFHFGANLYVGTAGGTGGGQFIGAGGGLSFPRKARMLKVGNDVKYSLSTDGTTWTDTYTHVGILAGKTTLYPRVCNAGPQVGQNLRISRGAV